MQTTTCTCFNCKLSYPRYFEVSKNKYCYFCKLIYFMEQKDIFSIHVGYSTMPQEEIIKKTKEILNKENRMPTNKEIDKNSKLVLINPFILTNLIKLMTISEQVCFSNIRIFFSENIDIDNIKIKRLIDKPKPIIKSNIIPEKISILPHQKVIYDKYIIKYII